MHLGRVVGGTLVCGRDDRGTFRVPQGPGVGLRKGWGVGRGTVVLSYMGVSVPVGVGAVVASTPGPKIRTAVVSGPSRRLHSEEPSRPKRPEDGRPRHDVSRQGWVRVVGTGSLPDRAIGPDLGQSRSRGSPGVTRGEGCSSDTTLHTGRSDTERLSGTSSDKGWAK